MAATICGCSLRSSSATELGSIHFRLSMPEVSLPCRMRSISRLALSSPSALRSTDFTYSLLSLTSMLSAAVCSVKRSITLCTRSRGIAFILAMLSPTRCTSLGVMCLSTCEASSSPSDISRMAASSTPASSLGAAGMGGGVRGS